MHKPLLTLSLMALSSLSFSQTIDYDAINEQARVDARAARVAKQEAQRLEKEQNRLERQDARKQARKERKERRARNSAINAEEFAYDLENFKGQWDPDFKNTITKKRALNEVEFAQAETLKCVEKLVTKRLGGSKFAEIAAQFVDRIIDGKVSEIRKVTSECKEAAANLKSQRMNLEEASRVVHMASMELKTRDVLQTLLNPSYDCEISGVNAQAMFGVGAGVGIMKLECIGTNGKVLKAIGPEVALGGGFGVNASYYKEYNQKLENLGPILLSGKVEGTVYKGIILTSRGHDQGYGFPEGQPGYSSAGIGLIQTYGEINGKVGLRLPNGQRRWELLTDLLK